MQWQHPHIDNVHQKVELNKDQYIIHLLSPCEDTQPAQSNRTKSNNKNTNKPNTTPKTARPVISWSVHSNLKRIRRDDSIVSPLGLVWQMKTRANKQQHENAIQQSVSQEATKAQCGNRGSPQPGASRSQSASRAILDTIQKPAMTLPCGKRKVEIEHSETWCENGSKVKQWNYTGAQRPLRFLSGVLFLSSALKSLPKTC